MAPRKPKPGRDLATLRLDLAKQAHGWDPSEVWSLKELRALVDDKDWLLEKSA